MGDENPVDRRKEAESHLRRALEIYAREEPEQAADFLYTMLEPYIKLEVTQETPVKPIPEPGRNNSKRKLKDRIFDYIMEHHSDGSPFSVAELEKAFGTESISSYISHYADEWNLEKYPEGGRGQWKLKLSRDEVLKKAKNLMEENGHLFARDIDPWDTRSVGAYLGNIKREKGWCSERYGDQRVYYPDGKRPDIFLGDKIERIIEAEESICLDELAEALDESQHSIRAALQAKRFSDLKKESIERNGETITLISKAER